MKHLPSFLGSLVLLFVPFLWQNSFFFWMSKSRSPSPTRISISILQSPSKTKSPIERLSLVPSPAEKVSSPARDERKSPEPGIHPLSSPVVQHHAPESGTRRRRRVAEEPPAEEPMAKRIRTESPSVSHRSKNQSSPESDSQGNMADNEMEAKATDASDQAPPAPPPKKKRTRTLTTPHQSSVLHALLAQSRFPTTAMREEVGRSIGLSARKVQIWFQNQRQKARRPRNQGDSSLPTQYGPFQNVGEPSSSVHRFQNYGPPRPHYPGHNPEAVSGPSELPLRLLGPGMPGTSYPHQGYRPVLPAPSPPAPAPPPAEPSHPPAYPFPSAGSPHSYRTMIPSSRLSRSPRPNWRERERPPSRTLPPLLPRPSSSNPLPSFWGHPDIQQQPAPLPYRSLSPEQRFAAPHPPGPNPRAPSHLPPPFTLQPTPQWDERTYFPGPGSWSRRQNSQSARPRSMSPIASRRETSPNRGGYPNTRHVVERSPSSIVSDPSHSRAIPPRSGRYDPIRSTFVPYSSNPATPRMMHQDRRPQSRGHTDRDDRPLSRSR